MGTGIQVSFHYRYGFSLSKWEPPVYIRGDRLQYDWARNLQWMTSKSRMSKITVRSDCPVDFWDDRSICGDPRGEGARQWRYGVLESLRGLRHVGRVAKSLEIKTCLVGMRDNTIYSEIAAILQLADAGGNQYDCLQMESAENFVRPHCKQRRVGFSFGITVNMTTAHAEFCSCHSNA